MWRRFCLTAGQGIQLAKSKDGLNFTVIGTVVDVKDLGGKASMVSNPPVFLAKDGNYRMVFEGSTMAYNKNDRKLYSAVSSDGLKWKVKDGV